MSPDDITAVFPTLSSVDWQAYDANRLSTLSRERELLWQRYEMLLSHPNIRLREDAFRTWMEIDFIVKDLQAPGLERSEE